MQSKDGKDKCQLYRCSILSENYNGEPIAFERKILPGSIASVILQKIQKDFEGQRIRSESFSDRIIFMSMFSTISIWTRKGTRTLALSTREKSKCLRQDSLTDSGYSWAPQKKASGIKDTQSIVANGNSVLLDCGGIREFWKGRNTIHLSGEFDNIDFLKKHAANQLCFCGAVTKLCGKLPEADSGKASKGRPESARRTPREIQIKQEERKLLADIPRLPLASGNRVLQNLENFESMPFTSKIESLRAAAKFIFQSR